MKKDIKIIRGSKHKIDHDHQVGGHGMWKIAYADFMTALMAFFLMMWLTNSVSEKVKKGIADYFAPVGVSSDVLGTNSILDGGTNLEKLGTLDNLTLEKDIFSKHIQALPNNKKQQEIKKQKEPLDVQDQTTQKLFSNYNAEKEESMFEEAKKTLETRIQKDPILKKISDSFLIEITNEGLKIELIDKNGRDMFSIGGTEMLDYTRSALKQISVVIRKLPNKISITGHTDSRSYGKNAVYNNWDLSANRALEARRFLVHAGFPELKIDSVIGKADTDLLNIQDPLAPSNRRISILVLRNEKPPESSKS